MKNRARGTQFPYRLYARCPSAPGFIADAEPAATVSQVEIFGPVAVTMTFRTVDEAVDLANNTSYGLAASIWSENINAATELAARVKAGVVWINATNIFDANAPFGGYKESGYGREGAREGMLGYLKLSRKGKPFTADGVAVDFGAMPQTEAADAAFVDRTMKNYIGGKQTRPDGGASYGVRNANGELLGLAPVSGRKDIREAVEAALRARSWASNAHNRAQVLFYFAENLSTRAPEIADLIQRMTGASAADADGEVRKTIERCFYYAGMADKHEGLIHATKPRHLTLSLKEPVGVVGVIAPDRSPLLSLMTLVLPLLATGNRVVAVPSPAHALIMQPLYQLLDTSDVPAGVLNLLSGDSDALAKVLAEHDAVNGIWYCGTVEGVTEVERLSAGNLKQVWTNNGLSIDWADDTTAHGLSWLDRATQVKTVWIPYGA